MRLQLHVLILLAAIGLLAQTRPRATQINPRQIQLFPGDRKGTAVQPVQLYYGNPWYGSSNGKECVRVYLPMSAEIEARLTAAGYRIGVQMGELRVVASCRCDWCKP